MLDQERIDRLLATLAATHKEVIERVQDVEECKRLHQEMVSRTLDAHPFVGKNAEQRKYEADVVVANNDAIHKALSELIHAEYKLSEAQMRLDVAKQSISLWRALAYQNAGNHDA